jgi:23S rRNA-/tRNA-specific pseudouridylate synthase
LKKIFVVAAGDPTILSSFLAARGAAHAAVTVDGTRVSENFQLKPGMKVVARIDDRKKLSPRIVFEDDWIVVIDKPAGMASQGSADFTVEDWAKGAHLVHRLDRDASGLMALLKKGALTPDQMERHYLARVPGPIAQAGEIRLRIARDPRDPRKRRALPENDPNGQPARTRYVPLAPTLLSLTLETGRTHQIRVHLAAIGQPIDGDPLYGGAPAPRLMLHAHQLTLPHPRDHKRMTFRSEIDFTEN